MKTIMFAFLALVMSFSVVRATPLLVNQTDAKVYAQDNRVKIDPSDLPQAIKTALDGDEYTGWEINAAYKNTEKGTYEVELSNGSEKVTQKFDKEGKKIDE